MKYPTEEEFKKNFNEIAKNNDLTLSDIFIFTFQLFIAFTLILKMI